MVLLWSILNLLLSNTIMQLRLSRLYRFCVGKIESELDEARIK